MVGNKFNKSLKAELEKFIYKIPAYTKFFFFQSFQSETISTENENVPMYVKQEKQFFSQFRITIVHICIGLPSFKCIKSTKIAKYLHPENSSSILHNSNILEYFQKGCL